MTFCNCFFSFFLSSVTNTTRFVSEQSESSRRRAWSHTCNLLLKGPLPGVHLNEFDAAENLVHRANTTVRDLHGVTPESGNHLGQGELKEDKRSLSLNINGDQLALFRPVRG